MLLRNDKLQVLIQALVKTRDDELDCDYCADYLAEFAEVKLAGKTIPEALAAIDRHLDLCGDCAEEFELLKVSIQNVKNIV